LPADFSINQTDNSGNLPPSAILDRITLINQFHPIRTIWINTNTLNNGRIPGSMDGNLELFFVIEVVYHG